jgi:hypothetical protein
MAIESCLRRVAEAAHLSDEEAGRILDRVRQFRDEMSDTMDWSKMGPEIELFFQRAGYETEQHAIQVRRQELIRAKKFVEFRTAYAGRMSNTGQRLDHAIRDEVYSIADLAKAHEARFSARIVMAMREDKALGKLLENDMSFNEDIIRERHKPGSSRDERVKKFAALLNETDAQLRQALNDAGANIGELERFGGVHRHNREAILAKPREWEQVLRETVDWEKTIGQAGPTSETISAIRRHILFGAELVLDPRPADFLRRRGRMAARPLEHERILHFKDADGWMKYNRDFGQGGVLGGAHDYIELSTTRLAQMQKLGPNPEATLTSILEFEKNEIRSGGLGLGEEATQKALRQLDINNVAGGHGPVGRAWRMVSGVDRIPENLTVARLASGVRQWMSMAKLGGAVLSQFSDIPTAAMQAKVKFGYSIFDAWGETLGAFFNTIPQDVRREFAGLIDVFGDGVKQRLGARFDGTMNAPGLMSKAAERFFKFSGMTFWTDNFRAGAVAMISHAIGREAGKAFGELGPELAYMLRNYGLERHWDTIRKHMAWKDSQGRAYLVPEKARDIPDQVIDGLIADRVKELNANSQAGGFDLAPVVAKMKREARGEIEMAVHTLLAAELDNIIVTPDSRTRAVTTWGGLKAGTPAGELARTVMQIKGFTTAFYQKVLKPMVIGRPGQGLDSRLGNLALLIAQTTAFGYISMNAKRLARGEKPTWQNEDNSLIATGLAAMVQGGGAGLYGDFLLAERSRFGSSAIESLAGPTLGGPLNEALNLWGRVLNPEESLRLADVFNMGINNTPFINLWYSRAALDYAVLYSAREALSPGWLRRREQRMRRDGGREYIMPPTRHRLQPFE